VPDASRSVGVAQSLLGEGRAEYLAEIQTDYAHVRELNARKKRVPLWTIAQARANATNVDFTNYTPTVPRFLGRRAFVNFDLTEIVKYLDWAPFFQTWDLAGAYPAILQDEVVGEEARKVFADGQAMLRKIIAGRWVQANGVIGLYPANRVDDDIEFYTDESRSEVLMTWYGVRQQAEKTPVNGVMRPSRCLADFVATKASGIRDYAGMFAVTAGIGAEKKEKEFLDQLDDYSNILFKALCDRLAESFAECLHARVRRDLWGYAADETLDRDAMIAEKYQGIRPAPGYPACPDHTVKQTLFATLNAPEVGIEVTDSFAMIPPSSVSGFYLAHPQSTYFTTGQIGEDQVLDMARRRGMDAEELRHRLAQNLA